MFCLLSVLSSNSVVLLRFRRLLAKSGGVFAHPLLGVGEWMLLAPNEKPAALLTILQCAQQAPAAQAPWPQLSAVLRLRVCSVSSQMLNRTQEVTQEIVQRAFRSPTALLWQLSRWSSGNAAGLLQTVLLLN